MFRLPSGLYFSACLGSLFLSILCTCCSHFFWYCFISFTMFCAPVFSLIHSFFSLPNFVIPSKCLKNFICAASKRCSSLFFSIQASLPNFNAALAVMLLVLNFVSLFICFPKLPLNFNKTNYVLFTTKKNTSVNLKIGYNNNFISDSSYTKFLGVTMNTTLYWNNHVDLLMKKLSKACYIIRSTKTYMSAAS